MTFRRLAPRVDCQAGPGGKGGIPEVSRFILFQILPLYFRAGAVLVLAATALAPTLAHHCYRLVANIIWCPHRHAHISLILR